MLEDKINKIIKNPDKKKKTENLIVILIILVIAVITINVFWTTDKKEQNTNTSGKELATTEYVSENKESLKDELIGILSKIDGVGNVDVLITYSESSSIIPIYNQKNTKSITEETDTNGGTRTIENIDENKEVFSKTGSEPVTEKVVMPKIEGAIIAAEGADKSIVKNNIIMAVEAATGLPNYKIQVFKRK